MRNIRDPQSMLPHFRCAPFERSEIAGSVTNTKLVTVSKAARACRRKRSAAAARTWIDGGQAPAGGLKRLGPRAGSPEPQYNRGLPARGE